MLLIIFYFLILNVTRNGLFTYGQPVSWNYQIGSSNIDDSISVYQYDIDVFDVSASDIARVQNLGRKVICYIDFGTWENWRPDASKFSKELLGNDNGWPGEKWLDINNLNLRPLMENRIKLAKSKGCNSIEADNVDEYSNGNVGFNITFDNQLRYNIWTANTVHKYGMDIGLKNDLDQVPFLIDYFDFLVLEECLKYNECELGKPFLNSGKHVFDVEYASSVNSLNFCIKLNKLGISGILKRPSLKAVPICSCVTNKCF
jgi:hypothetical protein